MDAALEVAVARDDGCGDQVLPVTALATSPGSGPELPMQVVQP
jgi:hypothetical protein